MFYTKKSTNDSLLAAIDSGSIDNVLSGRALFSDRADEIPVSRNAKKLSSRIHTLRGIESGGF